MSSHQRPGTAIDPDQGHGEKPAAERPSHVERRSPPPDVVLDLRPPLTIVTPASSPDARPSRPGGAVPGDVIDGTYRVIRQIGEGGMGTVYEVEHCLIKRRGALKVLHRELAADQDLVTRFLHEAQAAAAIGSEQIVEVTDAGIAADGVPYLVMELLDGRDLRQELRARGRLAPARAASLVAGVCRGLAAAHSKGIVHRDLKPENLLIHAREDGGEGVKILDFGMAKFHDLRITGSDATLGSPFFMAPEQFGGSRDVDHRCDIYALGVILYETLTGELPFKGPSLGELVFQVVMTTPTPPRELCPEIPERLEAVVLKAMASDPEDRHQSATELADALASFRASLPDTAAPSTRPRMVLVPAGWFVMGSRDDAPGRFGDEGAHEVVISRPFWLAATPVTQAEWRAAIGNNPSHFSGPNRPVEMVSWFDAIAYCNALSVACGLEPAYVLTEVRGQPAAPGYAASVEWRGLDHPGYRLPTEAEWEYACRAGEADAAPPPIAAAGWCRDTSGGETRSVGLKRPSALGLHDMLGNVWEWCWDWYAAYPSGTVVDPVGPASALGRVDRGGGWDSEPALCRPADRDGFTPGSRTRNLGFRVARTFGDGDA